MPYENLSKREDGKTGFALLHGAMLGAWIWSRTAPLLEAEALAVDLPGRASKPADPRDLSLQDVVDSVAADIGALRSANVILVAHSIGSVLVPGLIDRLGGRVVRTVYIAAPVVRPGEHYLDTVSLSERVFLRVLLRFQTKGFLAPSRVARKSLCNDLDEETSRLVTSNLVREVPSLYLEQVTGTDPSTLPVHYVRLRNDAAVSQDMQNDAIARLEGSEVHDLDTGHLPMLGRPDRMAMILDMVRRQA